MFNTADLDLSDVCLYSEALKTQQVQSCRTLDKNMERAIVHFTTPLPAGSKAQLQVGFQGKLTSSMQGYYKSSWVHEGKQKYYALTQFEVRTVLKGSYELPYSSFYASPLLPGVHSLAGMSRCSKRPLP